MVNIKFSIHVALICLAALLYASITSADCPQEATTLPQCNPAANPPCYVVGSNRQFCESDPANRFTADEFRPEYQCYSTYGICERDDNGQCGWRSSDELSQCIADMRTGESIKRCTTCPPILQPECP